MYKNDEVMKIGKAKILKKNVSDKVLVIGDGVKLNEDIDEENEI
jgi:hypothetical protein